MSYHTRTHSPGVFTPSEMAMLRALLAEMRSESWFPQSEPMQEKFAAFLLNTYDRGVICPAKLKAYCAAAAAQSFNEFLDSYQ